MTTSLITTSTLRKTAGAIALALLGLTGAQAADVNGTIYRHTADHATGAGTTVDYWSFTLTSAANVVIDVRANEGYVTGWGNHPGAYVDLNNDGEITLADTQFRLFQGSVALDSEVLSGDDSPNWSAPGNTNGWADGSLNGRDSYVSTALDVGTYILALGDFRLDIGEAVAGFNPADAITAGTGINPFTGATGQDHFDYQIRFSFTDFDTGAVLNVTPTAVPLPGAVWLFGSVLAGLTAVGKRKKA